MLYGVATSRTLSFVFALLLIFAGVSGMTGLSRRMRTGPTALLGTMLGERTLRRIPERLFQQLVGAPIAALGVYQAAEKGKKPSR